MAREILRLRSKMFDTPLLIEPRTYESIMGYMDQRCSGDMEISSDREDDFTMNGTFHYEESALGVIHIDGPLTNKPTGWEALCGGTSYQSIKEDFETLVSEGVKTVAIVASSGGGEAYGMMETGEYLRDLADRHDIKIISYVEGIAASACYGLISVSDTILSNKMSELGSIGVLVRLMNDSKALEKEGYQRTFITAGKSKVPFDKNGDFAGSFLEDLQQKVDVLYHDFTEYVAKHRSISTDSVKGTEAKMFLASDAVEIGLADGIMTSEEFYTYITDIAQQRKGNETPMFTKNKLFLKQEDTNDMTLAKMQEQEATIASLQEQLVEAQAFGVELANVKDQLVQMEEQKTTLEASLEEAKASLEAVAKEKEQMKMDSRKEKLSAVLSTEQVESVFPALVGLEDSAFEAVLGSYSVAAKAVEQGEMFKEMGAVGTDTEQEAQPEVDTTTALLQARFGK